MVKYDLDSVLKRVRLRKGASGTYEEQREEKRRHREEMREMNKEFREAGYPRGANQYMSEKKKCKKRK